MATTTEVPPDGLREPAAELWLELRKEYQEPRLSIEARTPLDLLAQPPNRLAQMREELDQAKLAVEGSKGQVRPHPLLSAETQLREEIRNALVRWHHVCLIARSSH